MIRRLAICLILSLPLLAQNSSLSGVVNDQAGGAVPGASVKIENEDTSASRAVLSDDRGQYEVLQVAPGKYKVTIEKPGFSVKSSEVMLQTNTPATLNVALDVGTVTATVEVTGTAEVVNTENASVGNPFTETQVKEIPLQTRNIVALLGVQPGAAVSGQVLGARADQNNVTLDGVDVNDNAGSNGYNSVLPIPLDSVQEFRTTVAGFGADQGRSSGGQVSIVTKSGSNQFHGTLYEYNRNTDFSANSWFSNRAGVARAPLIRNQYGASLGGPILKNKLFFFYNWEGRKDRSGTAVTRLVPSETLKAGEILVPLKSGQVVTLNQAAIAAIDPLHIGESSFMTGYLKSFPAGNNPLASPDLGLNFNELTFNAPQDLNNHAQVGKLDYLWGKQTIAVRGTLNGASVDGNGAVGGTLGLAQLPGQSAAQKTLDNSRGIAVRDTAVLSANLINVFGYGYTRLGTASTGTEAVVPTFYFVAPIGTSRPTQRIAPTTNFTDDMTWTKGRHTIQYGVNFRFAQNTNLNFNNVPSYSFSRNTLLGLGGDIDTSVLNYLTSTGLPSNSALASGTNITNAFGAVLGLINQYGATYNYTAKGSAIPFGNPVGTSFEDHEYEGYAQDSFKWKPNLTITAGLRYSVSGVPYEVNGRQVVPVTPLNNYFAQRLNAAANGIPNSQLSSSLISFALGGPANNGAGYYPLDKGDFGPRLAVAYSPESGSWIEKIMGKGSVFRAGGAMLYDHYGTAMAQQFANTGSPGLATQVSQPTNTNFTSAFRYSGNGFPTIPAGAAASFPLTPPPIVGGFNTFSGVSSTLKAPYEYVVNASYARPLPKKMSIELGYVGRFGHRGIIQQDYGQPLSNFKDPKSGQTFAQAGNVLAGLYNTGLTAAQVKANPGLVPNQAWFNNLVPGLANFYIPGSASANFFYDVYNVYAGSWLDALNDIDRVRQPNGGCLIVTGCNTTFMLQNSGLDVYTNNGKSSYNAMIIVLRRAVTGGWGYDFNYTWGHALDNGSATEALGTAATTAAQTSNAFYSTGALLQDAFNPNAFRGPSDFDSRQTVSADFVVELPVGKGKPFLGNVKPWMNEIIGGWQVSGLMSYHSGTPLTVSDAGDYNVNYDISAYGILAPGATLPSNGFRFDSRGIPSIFSNPTAVNSFVGAGPGTVGTRGIVRGPHFFNTDLAVSKAFRLPWEHQNLSFRAEAFNAFNNVEFGVPNLSLATPTTFGEITSYAYGAAPRVMQMALRYSF